MSVILLDREMVHYEVLGRGRPLVFLHGWVGSWRYWIPAMQAASVAFRTYALDLYGFGDSAKNQRYTLSQQVSLLEDFLQQMGIGRVALVGHGLGALIAMKYAYSSPAMVDRVMAVGCPLESDSIDSKLRNAAPAELAAWLLGRTPLTEPVLMDAPKTDPLALRISLNGNGQLPLRVWDEIQTACLLVHGQADRAVTPPKADLLNRLPEQAHAVFLENSGHFPMLEDSSKFNRLLMDFLSLPLGVSPRELQLKEEWKRRMR